MCQDARQVCVRGVEREEEVALVFKTAHGLD